MQHEVIEFTAELIRLPSVLGNEKAAADFARERMQALGFDHTEIDAAGNAIGVIDGATPGPTLLFDGHLDTVDVMPRNAWTHDPFGGDVTGSRLYGRGASDMKGAVAAMILGAALVDRKTIRGRIVVSASVGEEWVEGRALRVVMEKYPADYVVIGEATELNLVHAGRGRAEFVVRTQGRPAHASTPELGLNAVHRMMDVIREIEMLPMPSDPDAGNGVMALTAIVSDPYPGHSVIPSGCTATYERRLMPGETKGSVLADLRAACASADAADTLVEFAMLDYTTYTGIDWRQPKWFSAWVTPRDHDLVTRAKAAMESTGLSPTLTSYQFCTNAAYSAGIANVPTIGIGPGSEALAHVVDEFVEIDQLEKAVDVYRAVSEMVLA